MGRWFTQDNSHLSYLIMCGFRPRWEHWTAARSSFHREVFSQSQISWLNSRFRLMNLKCRSITDFCQSTKFAAISHLKKHQPLKTLFCRFYCGETNCLAVESALQKAGDILEQHSKVYFERKENVDKFTNWIHSTGFLTLWTPQRTGRFERHVFFSPLPKLHYLSWPETVKTAIIIWLSLER